MSLFKLSARRPVLWSWRALLRPLAAFFLLAVVAACGGGTDAAMAAREGAAPLSAKAGIDAGATEVFFTASDADIPNPERGFSRWVWSTLVDFSADDAQDAYRQGYRLLYAPLNLSSYRTSALPDKLLTRLDTAFARARAAGVKLVVRAAYNYPASETEYKNAKDATLARVLGHIAQLQPVLQRNADVIAFMQAGFIGAWGEWHTSSNKLTTLSNRTQIRDALLNAVPASRFIQLRYPPYLMDWTPTLPTLDAVLAGGYRIGLHNDCFLASATDVGTYDDNAALRTTQRSYTDQLGDLAPFGGETCDPADEESPTPRSTCADILAEGARYNLTYLNDEYFRDLFHDRWTRDGCMSEIKRRMGYRLELVSASHAASAVRGAAFPLELAVRNTGWARVFNPRGLQVVLRHAETGAVRRVDAAGADPRRWLPGGEQAESLSITLPADLPAGRYEVSLALPDPLLPGDARYAIRPANADNVAGGQRWDAALGAFALGTSLTLE